MFRNPELADELKNRAPETLGLLRAAEMDEMW
jgi:hypothetical protein